MQQKFLARLKTGTLRLMVSPWGCTISQHLSLQDMCTSACMVLGFSQFTGRPVYLSTNTCIICPQHIVIDSAASSKVSSILYVE